VIILDLGLPDMSGIEVLESVRAWSNVPVIVLSIDSEEEQKVLLLKLGADD
jgi:two-component system, OmpR family, KDP operon response regulator KdpE